MANGAFHGLTPTTLCAGDFVSVRIAGQLYPNCKVLAVAQNKTFATVQSGPRGVLVLRWDQPNGGPIGWTLSGMSAEVTLVASASTIQK